MTITDAQRTACRLFGPLWFRALHMTYQNFLFPVLTDLHIVLVGCAAKFVKGCYDTAKDLEFSGLFKKLRHEEAMSRVVLIRAEAQSMEKKFFGRFVALALDITAPVLFGLLFTFNLYGWNQGMFYISAGQAGKNSTIAAADGDSDERKATDVEKVFGSLGCNIAGALANLIVYSLVLARLYQACIRAETTARIRAETTASDIIGTDFASIDTDGDDELSKEELARKLGDMGLLRTNMDKLFDVIDLNKDGRISKKEFRDFYEAENKKLEVSTLRVALDLAFKRAKLCLGLEDLSRSPEGLVQASMKTFEAEGARRVIRHWERLRASRKQGFTPVQGHLLDDQVLSVMPRVKDITNDSLSALPLKNFFFQLVILTQAMVTTIVGVCMVMEHDGMNLEGLSVLTFDGQGCPYRLSPPAGFMLFWDQAGCNQTNHTNYTIQ